jgi:hypothetical protein
MKTNTVNRRRAVRMRARVFKAFLRAARGAAEKAAYTATVQFWRASGHACAKQLSA